MVRFIWSSGTVTSRTKSEPEEGSQRLCPNLKCIKTPDQKCRLFQNVDNKSHDPTLVKSFVLFLSEWFSAGKNNHSISPSREEKYLIDSIPDCLFYSGRCHLHPDGLREARWLCRSRPDCSDGPDEPRLCDTVQGTTLCPLVLSAALCFPSESSHTIQWGTHLTQKSVVLLHCALLLVMTVTLTPFILCACVLRISVSTTWAAVAVSYWITDTSVSSFFGPNANEAGVKICIISLF